MSHVYVVWCVVALCACGLRAGLCGAIKEEHLVHMHLRMDDQCLLLFVMQLPDLYAETKRARVCKCDCAGFIQVLLALDLCAWPAKVM